ncbi:MAG: hydrogenase maturation protease [Actinomycetota bacterium]|nr:hydrogenase maturation protease [Actinomycetota bacterium]
MNNCRVLIGGFGRPGQRDLDFGRHLVSYLEQLEWPSGVVVEDLSYSAPMVLHRLQELRPAKVVFLGAVPRGVEPGSIRRYRLDLTPPRPEEVQQRLEESVQGMVDLDHTLAVARHWGGLPVDTTVVEVEPADCSFGVGFSEDLAAVFDGLVALVREEVGGPPSADDLLPLDLSQIVGPEPERGPQLTELADFARRHKEARALGGPDGGPTLDEAVADLGLVAAGRSLPWSVGVRSGGDWYDTIRLDDERVAVVIGDVAGRGLDATASMSELRAAVRAFALLEGHSPARLIGHLDRLAETRNLTDIATLLYLVVDPGRGTVRLCNAGHCPPLLLSPDKRSARFLRQACSPPLAAASDAHRAEAIVELDPGSSLLLFTNGLVASRTRSIEDGLECARRAALAGPDDVDALCDHMMTACLNSMRRDDDACLLGLRLTRTRGRRLGRVDTSADALVGIGPVVRRGTGLQVDAP